MKNKILSIFLGLFIVFVSVSSAEANVRSEYDISRKIAIIEQYEKFDFISLINKAELIGKRLEDFNFTTDSYANEIHAVSDILRGIKSELAVVESSTEISDTDKAVQKSKLLKDADNALNTLDTNTFNYLIALRRCMPSITYNRYANKLTDKYNSLDITNRDIKMGR